MLFDSGSYRLGLSSGSLERFTETYNFSTYLTYRDGLSPKSSALYFYGLIEFNSDQVRLNSHLEEVGVNKLFLNISQLD